MVGAGSILLQINGPSGPFGPHVLHPWGLGPCSTLVPLTGVHMAESQAEHMAAGVGMWEGQGHKAVKGKVLWELQVVWLPWESKVKGEKMPYYR